MNDNHNQVNNRMLVPVYSACPNVMQPIPSAKKFMGCDKMVLCILLYGLVYMVSA